MRENSEVISEDLEKVILMKDILQLENDILQERIRNYGLKAQLALSKDVKEEAARNYNSLLALNPLHSEANYQMGKFVELGEAGITKNEEKAVGYYHKAADQSPGHKDAQFRLGQYYRKTSNNFTDPTATSKMINYYVLAAKELHLEACFHLAECYENGWGVEKNLEKAERLYAVIDKQAEWTASEEFIYEARFRLAKYLESKEPEKAVSRYINLKHRCSHKEAIFRLGLCDEEGRGTAKSEVSALVNYRLAAEKGHEGAKEAVERLEKRAAEEVAQGLAKQKEAKEKKKQFVSGFSWSKQVRNAQEQVKRENDTSLREAFELFQSAAQKENREAQFQVALCFQYGLGVTKNNTKANKLLKELATKKYAPALFHIGLIYEQGGPEVKSDLGYQNTLQNYRKAAEQDHPGALYHLGLCYESGRGVKKNPEEALEYYRRAAAQNHPDAQYKLGLSILDIMEREMYLDDLGIRKDRPLEIKSSQEAMKLFRLAANQGHAAAKKVLEERAREYFEEGKKYLVIAKDLKSPRAQKDRTEGADFLKLAADPKMGGYAPAQFLLAQCYQQGIGVKTNPSMAMKCYKLAAAQNHVQAQVELGMIYANVDSSNKDDKKARELFEKATEKNHPLAQFYLGRFYELGIADLPKDEKKALELFHSSAKQNCSNAQNKLGECAEQGALSVAQNVKEAVKYYKLAANQRPPHAGAQCNLARCYENGIVVKKDLKEALRLYQLAAKKGNANAQNNLGRWYRDEIGGLEQNFEEAREWFLKAADQGHADAQYNLAECHRNGWGDKIDREKAAELYEKVADPDQKNINAQYKFGVCLLKGEGVLKDEKRAVGFLRSAADEGNVDAQFTLAEHLLTLDKTQAEKYFRLAADSSHKHKAAALALARMYETAKPPNLNGAIKYYLIAAEQGDISTFNKLGEMNEKRGNKSFAFDYYKRAAEKDDLTAQYHVGRFYQEGIEVKKDLRAAIVWFEKAQAQTRVVNLMLAFRLGKCYQQVGRAKEAVQQFEKIRRVFLSLEGHEKADPENVEAYLGALIGLAVSYQNGIGEKPKNEQMAGKYYISAQTFAENNDQENSELWYRLGFCYEHGMGDIKINERKAVNFYKLAAEKNYTDAQFRLAIFYEKGWAGLTPNDGEALRLYHKAAMQNHPQALFHLGMRAEAEAEKIQDKKLAAQKLKTSAEYYRAAEAAGDKYAAYHLGRCYEAEKGIKKDVTEAFRLYQIAAEVGYPDAQYALGVCYKNGVGVKKDLKVAADWLSKSADQGNGDAVFELAVCYQKGSKTLLKDLNQAFAHYYKIPTDHPKFTDAQKKLAECHKAIGYEIMAGRYERGEGVKKDIQLARELYELAVKHKKTPTAMCKLAFYYEKDKEALRGDSEKTAEAEIDAKLFKFYKKAAESGIADAQYRLAKCYDEGRGAKKDLKQAVRWAKEAAKQNHPNGQRLLGKYYENGVVIQKKSLIQKKNVTITILEQDVKASKKLYGLADEGDQGEAFQHVQKLAAKGVASAQYILGVYHEHGMGKVQKDEKKAAEYYELAADQGHAMAQNNYAMCLDHGRGTLHNEPLAVEYYKKSAKQSHAMAQYNLGIHYQRGISIEKDDGKAVALYREAAKKDHHGAQDKLAECYENGWGVTKDMQEALRLYELAAARGNKHAQARLVELQPLQPADEKRELVSSANYQGSWFGRSGLGSEVSRTPQNPSAQLPSDPEQDQMDEVDKQDILQRELSMMTGSGQVF